MTISKLLVEIKFRSLFSRTQLSVLRQYSVIATNRFDITLLLAYARRRSYRSRECLSPP